MNFWPPLVGAGIRVRHMSDDLRAIDVEMKLHRWNQNYVGTHYGGSLYSMTDPFYMLMLIQNLGRDYIVWDKAASIRFKRPGRGLVRCEFRLTQEQIDQIQKDLEQKEKIEPIFQVSIVDTEGEVVALVEKTLSVRKKSSVKPTVGK